MWKATQDGDVKIGLRRGGTGQRGEALSDDTDSAVALAPDDETPEACASVPPSWYVLWTRSNCEQQVCDQLAARGFQPFLPKIARWSRRGGLRYLARVPMFPGYLFVRPRLNQYETMHYIRGSCGLVLGGGNKPAPLPEKDLQAVRALVDSGAQVMVDPELVAGRRVRVLASDRAGSR